MSDEITITLPPARKFLNNSLLSQAAHIREEAGEIIFAVRYESEENAIIETLDCIQSCITLLAIFQEQGHDIELERCLEKMKEKNLQRGYYEQTNNRSFLPGCRKYCKSRT